MSCTFYPYLIAEWMRTQLCLTGILCFLTLSPMAPCAPLYLTALGLICPNKNRADLPEARELRATAIAALSLRVSLLNNFFLQI